MYETLKRLFLNGKLSADGLRNAVKKGWLTQDEASRITAMKNN